MRRLWPESKTLSRLLTAAIAAACVLAALSIWRPRVWPSVDVSSQAAQQTPETFLQATRRALAQGRAAEAESLAKARPANDGDAAAVLARLASSRGQYDQALKLLEAAVTTQAAGEAALELGLLQKRQFGKADVAAQLLNRVLDERHWCARAGVLLPRRARRAGARAAARRQHPLPCGGPLERPGDRDWLG